MTVMCVFPVCVSHAVSVYVVLMMSFFCMWRFRSRCPNSKLIGSGCRRRPTGAEAILSESEKGATPSVGLAVNQSLEFWTVRSRSESSLRRNVSGLGPLQGCCWFLQEFHQIAFWVSPASCTLESCVGGGDDP